MKKDLFTSIVVFTIGIIVAYVACGFIMPKVESTTVRTAGASITSSVAEPDPEIFNYLAINPVNEVIINLTNQAYLVCVEYDDSGNCISTESLEEYQLEEQNESPELEESPEENPEEPEEPEEP